MWKVNVIFSSTLWRILLWNTVTVVAIQRFSYKYILNNKKHILIQTKIKYLSDSV